MGLDRPAIGRPEHEFSFAGAVVIRVGDIREREMQVEAETKGIGSGAVKRWGVLVRQFYFFSKDEVGFAQQGGPN